MRFLFSPQSGILAVQLQLAELRKPRSMFTQPYSQIVEISGGSRAGGFYVTAFLSSLFNRERGEMLFCALPSGDLF